MKLQVLSEHIEAFKAWLTKNGWAFEKIESPWTAIRVRKNDQILNYYSRKGKQNLTVPAGMETQVYIEFLDEEVHA